MVNNDDIKKDIPASLGWQIDELATRELVFDKKISLEEIIGSLAGGVIPLAIFSVKMGNPAITKLLADLQECHNTIVAQLEAILEDETLDNLFSKNDESDFIKKDPVTGEYTNPQAPAHLPSRPIFNDAIPDGPLTNEEISAEKDYIIVNVGDKDDPEIGLNLKRINLSLEELEEKNEVDKLDASPIGRKEETKFKDTKSSDISLVD